MESQRIFKIEDARDFNSIALDIFKHQFTNNKLYREYCIHLGRTIDRVNTLADVPFLPIGFFKKRKVICEDATSVFHFTSSGTTATNPSRHFVPDISLYERSYLKAFEFFYGPVNNFTILALLPSYLERQGSSLIYMVNDLIEKSGNPESGFYLDDLGGLRKTLIRLREKKSKILLIGVSFALLDMADRHPVSLPEAIIMETGGMKGRKKEMVREDLHERLKKGFDVPEIHSEYGMTELLSQAYSSGGGKFSCPPWMRILIRDTNDPLSPVMTGKTGGINIIDLANFHSCAFIATQDLGRQYEDGHFEILGRFDHSDIRGCNLMVL